MAGNNGYIEKNYPLLVNISHGVFSVCRGLYPLNPFSEAAQQTLKSMKAYKKILYCIFNPQNITV